MRPKSLMLLALALGCGLVASIGISQVLERRNAAPASNVPMEPIFVALKDVNLGDPLTPQVLKLEEWPKDKVPPGAITKIEELEGRRPKMKIFQGEPILEGKLIGAENEGVAPRIPKGFRVVPVRVDAVSSVSGLILPGDRVDVLVFVSRNPGQGISETTTKTILQDVKVFAVDTQFRRENDNEESINARTISLLLSPEQAEKVTLAAEMGKIRLVMRSPEDDLNASPGGAKISDIFGGDEKSDRESESSGGGQHADNSNKGKGLLDWIRGAQQTQPKDPQPVMAVVPQNWTMMLLEGAAIREVSFPAEGGLPQVISGADMQAPTSVNATSTDAGLSGDSNQQNSDTTEATNSDDNKISD